jgi:hypothetical protein
VRPAAVAAALAFAAATALIAGCGGSDTPKLAANDNESLAFPVRVGKPFGLGLPVVRNRSNAPLRLESASLEGGSGVLKVLKSQAADDDRRLHLIANSLQLGFINRSQHPEPVQGIVIPAAGHKGATRGTELIWTLEAPAPGEYTFDAVRVDFASGNDHFSKTFPFPVRICATPSRLEHHCPTPKAPG